MNEEGNLEEIKSNSLTKCDRVAHYALLDLWVVGAIFF